MLATLNQIPYCTFMFAKVFGQIFDSSIAQDYNCRRMFIDLLVLADPTGAVDMTPDAISRRTNVPLPEVQKYLTELCQPDPLSRSQLEQGKRLVQLDKNRDWGWRIVNYMHYRRLRDEESRRSYFRDASKKYRQKKKKQKEEVEEGNQSPSLSIKRPSNTCSKPDIEAFCQSIGLPRSDGEAMFLHWEEQKWPKNWKLTIQKWKSFGYLPSQKVRKFGAQLDLPKKSDPSKIDIPERFKSWVSDRYPDKREEAMKWRTWADVPKSGLRDEWWKEEKSKMPVDI